MNREAAFERLHSLRANLGSASVLMAEQRSRFDTLAGRHENGTAPKAVSSFNLFQTPIPVVDMLMSKLSGRPHVQRILEPSAGLARIVQGIKKQQPNAVIKAVEISQDCCRELERQGIDVICADFISVTPAELGYFDAICMNPPFKMGTDVQHIQHAYKFLEPGGILISLCYNGVAQNRALRPWADTWELLPQHSFRCEGTDAEVVLLTKTKE
jgi:SAM-dependent methyltransferase